jgi:lysozyme family protein
MTAANLNTCAAFTFQEEGDQTVTRDIADPGCWSAGVAGVGTLIGCKYGVSAAELTAWLAPQHVTVATMAGLDQTTATAIFASRYWQAMNCDWLPGGLDLMVCDMGYNAGAAASVRLLQRLVGMSATDVDGWCGKQTIAAVLACRPSAVGLSVPAADQLQAFVGAPVDGSVGPVTEAKVIAKGKPVATLCALLADAQLAYYRSLYDWPEYGKGWTARTWSRLSASLALVA